MPGTALTWPF